MHPAASGLADEVFGYDEVGNRIASANAGACGISLDGFDHLEEYGAFLYAYDAAGRLVRRTHRLTLEETVYVWNSSLEPRS